MEEEFYYKNTDVNVWNRACLKEVSTPIAGHISYGSIPTWLNGILLRNGPGGNPSEVFNNQDGRVGSNTSDTSRPHLFDGPGLIQKFSISNQRVHYTNRYIRTKSFTRNANAKRLVLAEFGSVGAVDDVCYTIFRRALSLFQIGTGFKRNSMGDIVTDNANISIHPFGDEIYTLAETPFAHRINLDSLLAVANIDCFSQLAIINHTSHPHIIAEDEKVINLGQRLSFLNGIHYVIVEMDTPKKANCSSSQTQIPTSPWTCARILHSFPCRWPLSPSYMHSFSVTENYIIIVEQPLTVFLPKVAVAMTKNEQMASCLKFFPDEVTVFHVFPRHPCTFEDNTNTFQSTLDIGQKKFKASSFFFLHTINAFESEECDGSVTINVDICTYKDASMIECMYYDTLKSFHSNPNYAEMFRARPTRFKLKLGKSAFVSSDPSFVAEDITPAESERIVDIGCETPRINYEKYNGKPYEYFYAISSDVDAENPGTLIKVHANAKVFQRWTMALEDRAYPSEPIFVPRPDIANPGEDDGLILSTVVYGWDGTSNSTSSQTTKTSLIILDAKLWILLAKVDFDTIDSQVPKCLHGWFFPNPFSNDEDLLE